jgi:hypothetical protein
MPKIAIHRDQLFQSNGYRSFRKGGIYSDPRIQQNNGRDFLVISSDKGDLTFLENYLSNKNPRYPCEAYNGYTTGRDKHGAPMIGLYWIHEDMEQSKRAIIVCNNGSEESVLELVDQFCEESSVVDQSEQQPTSNAGRYFP